MTLEDAIEMSRAPGIKAFALRQRTVEELAAVRPMSSYSSNGVYWTEKTLCGYPVVIVPPDAPEGVIVDALPPTIVGPTVNMGVSLDSTEFANAVEEVMRRYTRRNRLRLA